ncbi:MAG: DEAD/DEAH box helicase [Dialister sp.]
MNAFMQLGITDTLAKLLYKNGIKTPTEIQRAAIPAIFKGRDIVGRSETGTGKTLAYLLPVMQRIRTDTENTQVLIMTPTRELAKQVFQVAGTFAKDMNIDVTDVIGGRTIENQIQKLKRDPHIVIGTPGRLLDHLKRRTLDISNAGVVVLDEADQMLAAGFREDIDALIDVMPKKKQVLLFSATMTEEAKKLSHKYMKSAFTIDVSEKAVASTVEQRVYETTKTRKLALLIRHLNSMNPYMALVFCNTREGAHELAGELQVNTDFVVDEIHGDMTQGQRNQVIREFAKAKIQILVASDIAARGIDVEGVTHVFNYDIPRNLEYYIHRIGRTGRAGTNGISITYATPEDGSILRRLEKSIRETITKYDEKGNIRHIKNKKTNKKVVVPGMYKPTKKKEHKALGHKGINMRKKRKKAKESSGKRK